MTEVQDLPTFPSNRHPEVQKQEKDALIAQLDELLEQYLHTLDEYEKVRRDLSKQLSSGYLSLAQANFHNSSSATRYGQDCYDERMQAVRKVAVTEGKYKPDKAQPCFSTFLANKGHGDVAGAEHGAQKDQEAAEKQVDPSEPEEQPEITESRATSSAKDAQKSTEAGDKFVDPLRWFGILVPPALRAAQSTFVAAVEGPIPQLATVAWDLRNQEMEIGRVRKQIKKLQVKEYI